MTMRGGSIDGDTPGSTGGRLFESDPAAPILFSLFIPGRAAPQGSKSIFMPKDPRDKHLPVAKQRNHPWARPTMIESSKSLKPWRRRVRVAAVGELNREPRAMILGDVNLAAEFVFARNKSDMGTGRNAYHVKPSAPPWPSTGSHGDLGKLVRAVEDSLTDAGVWLDDRLVVSYDGTLKRWVNGGEPEGVYLTVTAASI